MFFSNAITAKRVARSLTVESYAAQHNAVQGDFRRGLLHNHCATRGPAVPTDSNHRQGIARHGRTVTPNLSKNAKKSKRFIETVRLAVQTRDPTWYYENSWMRLACADLCRPSLQSFFWSPFDGWKEKQNICWNELNLKCLQDFAGLIVDEQYPEICSTISTSVQNVQKHFVFFKDVKFSSWSGEITTTYSPSSSFSVSVRQVSVAFVSTNSTNVALSPTWPLHYVYIWSDKGHRWSPGWWDGVVTHWVFFKFFFVWNGHVMHDGILANSKTLF